MNWEVWFPTKAKMQAEKLPEAVQRRLKYLIEEIKALGPVRTNWRIMESCKVMAIVTIAI
jgi:hypothetical protein